MFASSLMHMMKCDQNTATSLLYQILNTSECRRNVHPLNDFCLTPSDCDVSLPTATTSQASSTTTSPPDTSTLLSYGFTRITVPHHTHYPPTVRSSLSCDTLPTPPTHHPTTECNAHTTPNALPTQHTTTMPTNVLTNPTPTPASTPATLANAFSSISRSITTAMNSHHSRGRHSTVSAITTKKSAAPSRFLFNNTLDRLWNTGASASSPTTASPPYPEQRPSGLDPLVDPFDSGDP